MRGRTRPGRLHAFDEWLLRTQGPLLASPGLLLDVGFGVSAVTTAELAQAFPSHQVIGIEARPDYVAPAREAFPGLTLLGHSLESYAAALSAQAVSGAAVGSVRSARDAPGSAGEGSVEPPVTHGARSGGTATGGDASPLHRALVVRLANVARGLTREDADRLHAQVTPVLVDGGLALEGSTDVDGHVSAFWVLRRRGEALVREALVFHSDGARGSSPWLVRDVLPRALRRDTKPGSAIFSFLSDWAAAWEPYRTDEPLPAWVSSVRALANARPDVDASLAAAGFCVWCQGA